MISALQARGALYPPAAGPGALPGVSSVMPSAGGTSGTPSLPGSCLISCQVSNPWLPALSQSSYQRSSSHFTIPQPPHYLLCLLYLFTIVSAMLPGSGLDVKLRIRPDCGSGSTRGERAWRPRRDDACLRAVREGSREGM